MPGYVKEALLKFQHVSKEVKCYGPSPYTPPQFGKKIQMVKVDTTEAMDAKQIQLLRQVCRTFLYYNRAVDYNMLHALNDLATRVTKGTQQTMKALKHFFNYCAANSEATVLYRASDMILHNHLDTACLVASEARSRAGGFIYFGNSEDKVQSINGPITVMAKIIKAVMSSAAEAEIGALYMNAQQLFPL